MGIELQYDEVLRSTNGERKATGLDRTVTPMSPGGDVVLTVDPQLQQYVEQRLDKALRDFGARTAVAVVMNSETGEIYAMAERDIAKVPFDPNQVAGQIARGTFKGTLNHPVVADATEPGSIIKPLTVLTAREVGKLRASYQDNGSLAVRGGPPVKNLGNAAYGANIDGTKALANSINTVIGRMSLDVGPETFYIQMSRYGFTQRTNIDLPGEAYGLMRMPDKPASLIGGAWSESDMVRDSFGQSMTATPIQAVTAINAIANDCKVMRPYLAASVRRGRETDQTLPVQTIQACSPAAARDVREMMAKATKTVVDQGKGKLAIPGYPYAGKTGTADRTTSNQGTTLTTYAGFLPARAPKLTILVKISDPLAATLAGDVAQPVWRDIAQQAVRMANIPPEEALR
jgi:cell division protein FtsI/penicillin-binding protein 2